MPKLKERFELTFGLYAYGVLLGAMYIYAYWRPIGFRIFPYLQPLDYLGAPLDRLVFLISPVVIWLLPQADGFAGLSLGWRKAIFICIVLTYGVFFVEEFVKACQTYSSFDFAYPGEVTVIFLCGLLFTLATTLALTLLFGSFSVRSQIISVIALQLAEVMAAGYNDGKIMYVGADTALFENSGLCGDGGLGKWVYLDKFGGQIFFLNSRTKVVCVRDKLNFSLASRKWMEISSSAD